jgi:hypothetical protein
MAWFEDNSIIYEQNPNVTLKELIGLNNAQSILNRSGYFPE